MDKKVLRIGVNIRIKRSDGRVHDAVVSGIDTRKGYVSVEWAEGDETKGKEVHIGELLAVNPNVCLKPSSPRISQTPSHNRQQQQPTNRRKTVNSPAAPTSGIPVPKVPLQQTSLENISEVPQAPPTNKPLLPPRPHPSKVPQPRRHSMLRQNSDNSQLLQGGGDNNAQLGRVRSESASQFPQQQQRGLPAPKSKIQPPSQAAAAKSVCLKEVEKLKKKREERRVKQAEQKQRKYEDYDPDNPNWEFYSMVRDYCAGIQITPITGIEPVCEDRICVAVRKRPLSRREVSRKETDIVTIPDGSEILVHEPKSKVDLTKYLDHHNFKFDYAFDESASNNLLYRYTAKPLVDSIFNQGMATCFAYGQTGSGKTHTMGGDFKGKEQDATKGIYALAAGDIFRMNSGPHSSQGLIISASFFEIYCSKVYDLLNNKQRLRALEDSQGRVRVVGLQETTVTSVADVLKLIDTGNSCRTSGTTSANQNSSRSHAVFQFILRKKNAAAGKLGKLHGKLSLIDLAGNERGADTLSSDRETRREGAEINKSLLALKECIRALGRKNAHLPFRGSTLTLVLRDSFVGPHARTCMIATISPGFSCCEHTLNTLRYAARVKDLTSKGGSGGPNSQPVSVTEEREEEDPAVPQESLEKSMELQSFQQAVSQLEAIEEEIVEQHRMILQESRQSVLVEERMLAKAEQVDADTEGYVDALKQIVEERIERLTAFKGQLEEYHQKVQEEEMASIRLKKLPPAL